MKRHFKKIPGALIPAFEEDEMWLARKKTGSLMELDIREPRNGKLHRKWWSLCNYLAEHSERFPTAEHASKWMLIQLGHYTKIRTSRGIERIADSISFANMDNDTFNGMYNMAMDLLCAIIPHVTDRNVAEVLAEYAGVGAMMGETA